MTANLQVVKNQLTLVYNSILKDIEDTLVNDFPFHGAITFSFIFRDSKLSRWITTREESRQVI
jgi:hypothetical protein